MADYDSQNMSCAQARQNDPLHAFALAMAYVPWQQWEQTYDLKKAMQAGTIFPGLDKPFLGKRGGCR